jgi:hypothetical protein
VRSLLKHFRDEFAEVMEAGRFAADELASEHAGHGSVDLTLEGGRLVAPGSPTA